MYYLKSGWIIILTLILISCGSDDAPESVETTKAPPVETRNVASRDINGIENIERMLFAAYAGIAYGDVDNIADNNIFYNIMFYNLNNMVAHLGFKAIPPEELSFSAIYQMAQMVLSREFIRPYKEVGVNEEIILKGSVVAFPPKIVFNVKSQMDFSETQIFSYNNWAWSRAADSSDSTNPDVEMTAAGELYSYQDKATAGFIPSINTFTIDTSQSLVARLYKYTVRYDNWHITYSSYTDPSSNDVPNMYILPLAGNFSSPGENPDFPDNREYSVSGKFTVNGQEYGYRNGFTYKQTSEIAGRDKADKPIITSRIVIEGALKIPGDDGYVVISSSDIYPIIRNADGIWEGGMLFINGGDDFAEIAFNNGNATIFYGSEEKTVNSWQKTLQPAL